MSAVGLVWAAAGVLAGAVIAAVTVLLIVGASVEGRVDAEKGQ